MRIALSVVLALFIVACSSEATKEEKVVETKKIEIVEKKSSFEKVTDKVSQVKDSVVEKVEDVKESVKETTVEVVDTVKDSVVVAQSKTVDADLLWNKCAGCHGGMGERAALGKSGVIRNWSPKQIEHALLGYQKGTYGRTMKSMMQKQIKNLSHAEIKAIAYYISDK